MPGMQILDVRMFETGEYALVRVQVSKAGDDAATLMPGVLGRDPDSASLVLRIPAGEGMSTTSTFAAPPLCRQAGIHPDIAAGKRSCTIHNFIRALVMLL
eukprot:SM000198S05338  [mRNA]  locus=s198:215976:216692:- [translate_table: standard]